MKLYVKPWCPWCIQAKDWLTSRGYAFEEVDVLADPSAYEEMKLLSRQSLTPVLSVNGLVLADFGTPELEAFVQRHGLQP